MNNSLKATLLSALVLPGAGQITLKHYFSGAVFALTSLIALFVILVKFIKFSTTIATKISQGGLDQSSSGLIGIISNSLIAEDMEIMSTAFWIYLGVWLLSIFDAYRIGNLVDKKQGNKK